ncbi:MAG: glycosyltransferase family 2 protein [Candidatus Bathycorpusculaceae bacterium]
MKVSVVIPTYYRSKDLAELLNSLLSQTVKPMEVIIVDDTPTDAIQALCSTYRDKFESHGIKLFFIKNQRVRSSAVARNIGVERAMSDIVMFLDSDVVLWPNYIEEILKVFKKHVNAVGVQGHIILQIKTRNYILGFLLNQLIRKIFKLQHITFKDSCKIGEYPTGLTKVINCESLCGSNMALKRHIFKKFKFDENLKYYAYMEDFLLSHSLFKEYPHGLYITPHAKCLHKHSVEGRESKMPWGTHLNFCRKYVLAKLFGWKGLLIYFWQNIGILILTLKGKIGDLLGF